jgi:predicted nucleic acid-binding Zn ribbon protein
LKTNKCPKCGTEITKGLKYCPKCGMQILETDKMNSSKRNETIRMLIICFVCILIVMLFVIASAMSIGNKQRDSSKSTQETSETTSEVKDDTTSTTQTTQSTQSTSSTTTKKEIKNSYEEIDAKTLTDYYYNYGYRQGNIKYFGKVIKTTAYFDYSDSGWLYTIVYMNGPSGSHYSVSCGSFKGDTFKKMSAKNKGDVITFVGKVDELVSSDNYKSGILGFEDCEIEE